MPDTTNYLILGLVILAAISLIFLGSMVARYRNLQKDLTVLEELQKDNA